MGAFRVFKDKRLWATALAGAALALAGCDGGDDAETETVAPAETTAPTEAAPAPLTREQFIAEADRVCQSHQGEFDSLVARARAAAESGTPAEQVAIVREGLELVRQTNDELAALNPPVDDAVRYLALREQAEQLAADLIAAIEAADQATAARLAAESEALAQEAKQLAAEYGFESCGAVEIAP